MKKIEAIILLKNRRIKRKNADPEKPFFIHNGTVYILDQESIGLRTKSGILSPTPMAIYHEGIPTAIRLESEALETSAKLLDNFVLENEYKSSTPIRAPFNWSILTKVFNEPQKIAAFLISVGVGLFVLKMFLFDFIVGMI